MNIWTDPPPTRATPWRGWVHLAGAAGIVLVGILVATVLLVGIVSDRPHQPPAPRAPEATLTDDRQ